MCVCFFCLLLFIICLLLFIGLYLLICYFEYFFLNYCHSEVSGSGFRHSEFSNLPAASVISSFSNDDGDGSENITIKMNSRFLKHPRDYSNSLYISNAGEISWS